MRFKGKKPVTTLHRKINMERRCTCGARLTFEEGDWTHPEVNDEIMNKKEETTWVIKIAVISDKCPFRRLQLDGDDICLHTENTSGICSEKNCKRRVDYEWEII